MNFNSLSVALYGGCDVAVTVFEKTYDGDLSARVRANRCRPGSVNVRVWTQVKRLTV